MPIYKMPGNKDGKQKYRVRINYTDRNGVPHQLDRVAYGSTEAKILESKLLQEYGKGAEPSNARMTVQELYDAYMYSREKDVRATTYNKSKRTIEKYVLPFIGDQRIDRLNAKRMQSWKDTILHMECCQTTRKNIYAEFRALLNYGVRLEYLSKNPLLSVGNFRDNDFIPPKDKLHYYTPEQFIQFISAARDAAEQENSLAAWGYYVFFSIAYYTGMRKGEIHALRWSDIEGDTINVRRSITQKLKGGDIETAPKNKSSYRTLQIPQPLREILKQHKSRQQQYQAFSEDFRICGGERCLRDTSIANKNIQLADAAGLPHIRIHDFRHSHASLLANEGINIQEIARRFGHAKIEQTWNTYAHLYPREEERAIQILDRVK